MIPFRLVIGVLGIFFVERSLSYTSYPGAGYGAPEVPYGYVPVHSYGAYPSTAGYGYGSKSYGYGSGSYSGSYGGCASMKVNEVLDHIFCDHGSKRRYTSTIYPKMEVVISQMEYIEEWFFIPQGYEYVQAAIDAANNYQDSTYGNFAESSLLNDYDEGYDDSSGQSQGSIAGVKGSKSSRSEVATKMASVQTQLKNNEAKTKALNNQGFFANVQSVVLNNDQEESEVEDIQITVLSSAADNTATNSKNPSSKTVGVQSSSSKTSKKVQFRAKVFEEEPVLDKIEGNRIEKEDERIQKEDERIQRERIQKEEDERIRKEQREVRHQVRRGVLPSSYAKRNATSYRKIRGTEYSDYTCPLLPPIYCSEDKYDELLYNLLERLFVIINFLYMCLEELDFALQDASSDDIEEIYLIGLAQGSILTTTYTLCECIETMFRYYEIMELEYGGGNSYRAKEGNPVGSNMQAQVIRPVMQPGNKNVASYTYVKPQTYPMTYVSQPTTISTYPMTQQPQQYRTNRAVVTPVMTQLGYPGYIVVG